MDLELRVETTELPGTLNADGTLFETYTLVGFYGEQQVGSVTINRVRETTNPTHRANPLLFNREGRAQPYLCNWSLAHGKEADELEYVGYNSLEAGAQLLTHADKLSQDRFDGQRLYAANFAQSSTENAAWYQHLRNGKAMQCANGSLWRLI